MDNVKKTPYRRLSLRRKLVQLYAALLYNAHLKGFISGEIYTGAAKFACVPGLNCYSCPGAVGACPLGALQNAVASSGNRAPFYILGILLLYGLILGRTVCGWLCPIGLVQELLHKIPTPKIRKSRFTRTLSCLKYIILAVFVLIIPIYFAFRRFPLPAFCKYICPAGTLEGAVGLLANPANSDKLAMLGGLFTWKFLVLLLIIGFCIFAYRGFCRFLCPLGAIYGLFNRFALLGVKVEKSKCVDCGACVKCCSMDVRHVSDRECISCGRCIESCPTAAISMKAGKATLIEKNSGGEKGRRYRAAAWILALAVLAAALIGFNLPQKAEESSASPPAESAAPVESPAVESPMPAEPEIELGSEEGMQAPDFSLKLYGGGEISLSELRGKTVVLNFWATWCSPCVAELPYFDELWRNYGENVAVIAIHSELVTDDVEEYLSAFDYAMPFGLDESGDILRAYGGSTMLPQTVVIDENGIISYNAVGSVSYEKLLELAE